jgi:urea-proton symporter
VSSELIAVSSIFTYDIYQTYIKPDASGKRLIYMSHMMVCVFGLIMAGFSTGLWYGGISLGYIYLMMGVIISSAVIPATLTLMWDGFNWHAATFSPPLGLACSLIAWLVTAKQQGGDLSVASTGANNPMLAGNVVALLSPLIFIPVFTLIFGKGKFHLLSIK